MARLTDIKQWAKPSAPSRKWTKTGAPRSAMDINEWTEKRLPVSIEISMAALVIAARIFPALG